MLPPHFKDRGQSLNPLPADHGTAFVPLLLPATGTRTLLVELRQNYLKRDLGVLPIFSCVVVIIEAGTSDNFPGLSVHTYKSVAAWRRHSALIPYYRQL